MGAFRAFFSIGLAAIVLALTAPAMFLNPPLAYTGVHLQGRGVIRPNVIAVDRRSPAYNAGLRTGDRVSCLSIRDQQLVFPIFGASAYPPRTAIHLCVQRGASWQRVAFAPARRPPTGYEYGTPTLAALRLLVYCVFLFCGIALVLARPSLLTWCLYAYCLSGGPGYTEVVNGTLQAPMLYAVSLTIAFVLAESSGAWLLLFTLAVPDDRVPPGWRRYAFTAAGIATAAFVASMIAVRLWTSVNISWQSLNTWSEAVTALAVFVVLVRLALARGDERARFGWAAFAILWGIVTNDLRVVFSQPGSEQWVANTSADLTIVMPIALMYAILKRHVIDVRFVISKGLVYAVVTTIVVGIIGLVDWLTSVYLSQARFAMAVDALVTIALGFLLHRTYRYVDHAVDFLLFRKKHDAESYLQRLAHTLPFAVSEASVDEALVHAPCEKLSLAAAALFRKGSDGFSASCARGWEQAALPAFPYDHGLLRFLIAERSRVHVGDFHDHLRAKLLEFETSPMLAIPLFQANELTGFALYAAHRDGTSIDPDEEGVLERLCETAALAYTAISLARYRGPAQSALALEAPL